MSATVVIALPSARFLTPITIEDFGLPSGFLLPREKDIFSVSYCMASIDFAISLKNIGEPFLNPTTKLS